MDEVEKIRRIGISKSFWDLKHFGKKKRNIAINNPDETEERKQLAINEISLIDSTTSDPKADYSIIEADYDTIKHLTIQF